MTAAMTHVNKNTVSLTHYGNMLMKTINRLPDPAIMSTKPIVGLHNSHSSTPF